MTNEEHSIDALVAAFKSLIDGAAKIAREKRSMRRNRTRKAAELADTSELEVDGCLCFRCAPCAWCLSVDDKATP